VRISVLGLGAVGGFGCGAKALLQPAPPGVQRIPWGDGFREFPAFRADTSPLERFVPKRNLRRIDAFSRMSLLGAHLALEDAGLPVQGLAGLGLVLGSAHGATATTFELIDSMVEAGDVCSSPIHFAGSLHNTPASHLAIQLGATGPSLTLSLFEDLVPTALLSARLWLAEGRVERVLVGVVDELSDLTGYLWARGPGGPPPGEGAAFLLLSRREEDGPGHGTLEDVEAACGPDEGPWGDLPGARAFALVAAAARS
jgi:3-oxoacyl-[acyl-carrier-protein] synthase II